MAPPGADTLTSSAPSAVGPRDDHVYCRSAAILERSEYCGCPICDETKAPTAIEQPEVPDEGRNPLQSDAIRRNQDAIKERGQVPDEGCNQQSVVAIGGTRRYSAAIGSQHNKTPTKCHQNTIKLRSRRNQGAIQTPSRRNYDAITYPARHPS